MRLLSRKSLKGQIVWRFSLVLGALLIVLNVGFLVLVLFLVPTTNDADREMRPIIADAMRLETGRLTVVETEDLLRIKNEFSSFWFAAVHPDGRLARYGPVPSEYDGVIGILNQFQHFDVRGKEGSQITASFAELDTRAGTLKVVYGGKATPGSFRFNVLRGMSVLYIPFTLIPIGLVFLTLPLLVGRALSGLQTTIRRAASIDANSLGARLPKDDVVEELHPLITAFNSALARIDEEVSQRQRFFANAAHELRTPIAILQTRLEGLCVGAEKARLLLDVGRLAATAEQLLDMQRFAGVLSWADVDLVALCETVVADCAPLAIDAGYELEITSEVKTFVVHGDRDSLERAVTNLVMNAVEHGGGAGVILIEVGLDGAIEISDDGPGIPKHEREKVFEPFYRTKPKPTGAGLGLSIVRQIALVHKGKVSIVQQVKGARFRFSLGR
jgi:signal transduction histidine kinase